MFERNTGLSLPIDSYDIPISPYCFPDDSVKGKSSDLELTRFNGHVISCV